MQIFIFLVCMLCGVVSGIVYDALYIARTFVCGVEIKKFTLKDKIFTVICDLMYFAVFSVMFVFISVCFEFYSVRAYMLIGCALGAIIYLKSLHVIIAFLIKKVYNKANKDRSTEKTRYGRRGKAQQDYGGGDD